MLRAKANSADLADVATSGDYGDLSNRPTLGTAAAQNSTAFATAAQGAKADTAVQPGALADVAFSGDYDDLANKPSGGGGGASTNPVPIAANYSAAVGDFVVPMAVGLTVTLPGSADHGDMVQVFSTDVTVTVNYFNLFTQAMGDPTLTPDTLTTFLYVADIDLGAGPMSGWYLFGQSAVADVALNPRFVLLSETQWGATTPEADRTYLVFDD